jgi:hypothetical protein
MAHDDLNVLSAFLAVAEERSSDTVFFSTSDDTYLRTLSHA